MFTVEGCGHIWNTRVGPDKVVHVCEMIHDTDDEYHECIECGLTC